MRLSWLLVNLGLVVAAFGLTATEVVGWLAGDGALAAAPAGYPELQLGLLALLGLALAALAVCIGCMLRPPPRRHRPGRASTASRRAGRHARRRASAGKRRAGRRMDP